MRNDYSWDDFSLDGVKASTKGIVLQKPISFSAAKRRISAVSVPGKSGDLHYAEEAFDNRIGSAVMYTISSTDAVANMGAINAFLHGSAGYKKLRVADDANHYWYASIQSGGEIAARLGMLNPFTVVFDCKPFRMIEGGETLVTLPAAGGNLTNPTAFKAYPKLIVTATGAGTITGVYGTIEVTAEASGTFTIDCEEGRAYFSNGASADQYINSDSFLYLPQGESGISLTGNISVQVSPCWREL